MLISLLLLFLITAGGLALTYLFARDESLLWRLSAGAVGGSVVFSLICFLLACAADFTTATVSVSYVLTLAPLALFARKDLRQRFAGDWRRAAKKLEGADFNKFARIAYYFFFLLLFWFFFQRAMMETPNGIFIGSSHNLGDLPFHLGAIFSFTNGQNFPPENPSYAFAKFTYPFMVDLIIATFVKFGARVSDAMLVQNVLLAFSLLVILERFTVKLTGSRFAGRLAPVLLFFGGGVGFLWFFKDALNAPAGFYDYFWNIPIDYTIRQDPFHWKDSLYSFRWGDSLTTLFLTQRSLVLGMPLTLIALQKIWEFFSSGTSFKDAEMRRHGDAAKDGQIRQTVSKDGQLEQTVFPAQILSNSASPRLRVSASLFLVGLLAGTLPLVHTHSLAVLFLVCACLVFFSLDKWREWFAFGAGVCVVAVPELLWAMTGSATRFGVFVDWHFGWSAGNENYVAFYARNLGLFIPLLVSGIYLVLTYKDSEKETEPAKAVEIAEQPAVSKTKLLIFYIPFLLCFIIPNIVRLAPWEWDNIKVLIYWFVGSIPFVALLLARLWEEKGISKIISAVFIIGLTLSGAIDVWRVTSRTLNYQVFEADNLKIAEQIKQKTAPDAMFLNAPTYNSAVVLSGRRSMMRYTGHLSSYGIDYEPRENELKRIYEGSALAESLLRKNNIEYVLISPEERNYAREANIQLNETYFQQFPVVAEAGQYRVYKVK